MSISLCISFPDNTFVYLNRFLRCCTKWPTKVANTDPPDVNHQVGQYLLPRWQILTHLMINITGMGIETLCLRVYV